MDATVKPAQPRMAELVERFFQQHRIRFWDLGMEVNDPKLNAFAKDVFARQFEAFVQRENIVLRDVKPLTPIQFQRFQQFMGFDPAMTALVERLGGAPSLTAAVPAEAFRHMMRPGGNPYLAADALEMMTPWHSQLPPVQRANLHSDMRAAINAAVAPGENKTDMATLMSQLAAGQDARREEQELWRRYEAAGRQQQLTNHHPSEWFPMDFNEHDLHRLRQLSRQPHLPPPSAEPSTTQFSRDYVREHRLAGEDTRRSQQNLMSARSGNEARELYAGRMMTQMQQTIAEQQAEIEAMRRTHMTQNLQTAPGEFLWERDGTRDPPHQTPSLAEEMRLRLDATSPAMTHEKAMMLMEQMQAMREDKPRDVAHRTYISQGPSGNLLDTE